MEFDFWWLFAIPLLFGLGWMAARLDRHQLQNEQGQLPGSYFKGLNFLLNEQPDQAIDAFIEVARLDPETTELHFALGNLFRRRGETERAIRVHQNLVNRSDLPVQERDHAMYELGQDFLKAGMLDRAEASFHLLSEGSYAQRAKVSLLEIHEVEKDWPKAIEAAQTLQAVNAQNASAPNYQREIAQFHCELAQDALKKKNDALAEQHLQSALDSQTDHVRATMLLGELQMARGQVDAALQTWHRIEAHQPQFLPLIAPAVMKAYAQLGQADKGLAWLRPHLQGSAGNELLDLAYQAESQQNGLPAAQALMRQTMLQQPSLAALAKMIEARTQLSEGQEKQELEVIGKLVRQRTQHLARYTCNDCGFRTRQFYWQCPGCNHWETYSPKRAEVPNTGPAM